MFTVWFWYDFGFAVERVDSNGDGFAREKVLNIFGY